jgi:O-antigen ligase
MVVVAFFMMSMKGRAVLVLSIVVGIGLSLLVLPNYVLARYLTVFSATQAVSTEDFTEEEARQLYGADVGSTQARLALLFDSIELTLEHPLFGVGMAQFPEQNWEHKKLQGKPGANFSAVVTHNVYTQFSSEIGIPALILFVVLLIQCFRTIGKIIKMAQDQDLVISAQALRLSLVVLAASGFFLAVAYSQMFYIMGGITARLYMCVLEDRRRLLQSGEAPRFQQPYQQPLVAASPIVPSVAQRQTDGLTPRSKLSPWRTNPSNVRNSRLS